MKSEYVILSHKQWVDAAELEGFDPYEHSTDDLEESWGLLMMGSGEDSDSPSIYSFEFMIVDKRKWFLAKIKHGF
jgi:hypothetical protein